MVCAMGATINAPVFLNPMTNDFTITVGTHRCQKINGTLETVKDVRLGTCPNFKSFVIIVSTAFTLCHTNLLGSFQYQTNDSFPSKPHWPVSHLQIKY